MAQMSRSTSGKHLLADAEDDIHGGMDPLALADDHMVEQTATFFAPLAPAVPFAGYTRLLDDDAAPAPSSAAAAPSPANAPAPAPRGVSDDPMSA